MKIIYFNWTYMSTVQIEVASHWLDKQYANVSYWFVRVKEEKHKVQTWYAKTGEAYSVKRKKTPSDVDLIFPTLQTSNMHKNPNNILKHVLGVLIKISQK